jgi:hypothetical protein
LITGVKQWQEKQKLVEKHNYMLFRGSRSIRPAAFRQRYSHVVWSRSRELPDARKTIADRVPCLKQVRVRGKYEVNASKGHNSPGIRTNATNARKMPYRITGTPNPINSATYAGIINAPR